PQALAVIRGEDEDRAIVEPGSLERPDQLAYDGIRSGDLAIVGNRVAALERLGRRVGGVRLVEMEEEKERFLAVLQNPWQRALQRLPARALVLARRARRRDGDRIFVELEAVVDP